MRRDEVWLYSVDPWCPWLLVINFNNTYRDFDHESNCEFTSNGCGRRDAGRAGRGKWENSMSTIRITFFLQWKGLERKVGSCLKGKAPTQVGFRDEGGMWGQDPLHVRDEGQEQNHKYCIENE